MLAMYAPGATPRKVCLKPGPGGVLAAAADDAGDVGAVTAGVVGAAVAGHEAGPAEEAAVEVRAGADSAVHDGDDDARAVDAVLLRRRRGHAVPVGEGVELLDDAVIREVRDEREGGQPVQVAGRHPQRDRLDEGQVALHVGLEAVQLRLAAGVRPPSSRAMTDDQPEAWGAASTPRRGASHLAWGAGAAWAALSVRAARAVARPGSGRTCGPCPRRGGVPRKSDACFLGVQSLHDLLLRHRRSRWPGCRVPVAECRPMALRRALSDGLPLSNCEGRGALLPVGVPLSQPGRGRGHV